MADLNRLKELAGMQQEADEGEWQQNQATSINPDAVNEINYVMSQMRDIAAELSARGRPNAASVLEKLAKRLQNVTEPDPGIDGGDEDDQDEDDLDRWEQKIMSR